MKLKKRVKDVATYKDGYEKSSFRAVDEFFKFVHEI